MSNKLDASAEFVEKNCFIEMASEMASELVRASMEVGQQFKRL